MSYPRYGLWLWAMSAVCLSAHADLTVIPKAVADTAARTQRLTNPGFESGKEAWNGWMQGFETADGGGRGASQGIRCVAEKTEDQHGAGQLVTLNQIEPRPIVASGWSRAEHVDGAADNGYSVYVDVNYADGDHLWGQTGCFSVGTHDWEQRLVLLVPEKAVASLTVHALFRGHNGTVWFDDFSLVEADSGSRVFEGVLVGPTAVAESADEAFDVAAGDGLNLSVDRKTGAISALHLNDTALGKVGLPVFVRDVAGNSDFIAPDWAVAQTAGGLMLTGDVTGLQLRLTLNITAKDGTVDFSGTVKDLRGADRAVTVYVPLPVTGDWTWSADMRRDAPAKGLSINAFRNGVGATGSRSYYPLAVLTRPDAGLALAVPIDAPRHHRLAHDADRGLFYAAFDLGLSPAVKRSDGAADFHAMLYACDPARRFRGALARYYRLFPDAFAKRIPREGLWMAFTDISTLPNPEDFGFAYQEGASNVAWDEQHDILSFPYTEPMTTWLKLAPEVPRSYDGAVAYLHALLDRKVDPLHDSASVIAASSVLDSTGRSVLSVVNAPWCDGVVFALNADPMLPVTEVLPVNRGQAELKRLEQAAIEPVNGATADGVYIDSYEFWANSIDYNSAHFANVEIPLVFDAQSCRVGVLTVFSTFAFQRELARRMHARGKFMFANGVLNNYDMPAACLDVLGTETNWMPEGKWQPMTDTELCYRRALCAQKPYCFLMNTHYEDFTLDLTERYMQRALAYGMFPGFFSENASTNCYFATPKWYEPARPLFRKYLPLIQTIARAGWEPVTLASSDTPKIYVERFGQPDGGTVYFTVLNDSDQPKKTVLTVDLAGLGWKDENLPLREMISDTEQLWSAPATLELNVNPEQALLIRLTKKVMR